MHRLTRPPVARCGRLSVIESARAVCGTAAFRAKIADQVMTLTSNSKNSNLLCRDTISDVLSLHIE